MTDPYFFLQVPYPETHTRLVNRFVVRGGFGAGANGYIDTYSQRPKTTYGAAFTPSYALLPAKSKSSTALIPPVLPRPTKSEHRPRPEISPEERERRRQRRKEIQEQRRLEYEKAKQEREQKKHTQRLSRALCISSNGYSRKPNGDFFA
eukprot:TRINITY_DN10668_c0_g1::TRINITY_DN10668_c0_g1_i1::g.11018::m.11018 TRINITY_DN10668_c0_g1::TRINITY_DN10668_c0_g1_i1::g.11018  ORF type:complete len:149 (-),score=-2.96,DUF1675/PF07897.6/0.031,PsiA/PF06952.6/0.097 TRINITY_DN10668_c0_g1_i1:32-478(-)